MLHDPQVNTVFSGDEEQARTFLPEAFSFLQECRRSSTATESTLEIDRKQRRIEGGIITLTFHHGRAKMHIHAFPGAKKVAEKKIRRKKRRDWIEREKERGQKVYYRMYVHLDLLTKTHFNGVYAGDEISRSDITNWLVSAQWNDGVIEDVQSGSIPLMNLGGGIPHSPTWDGVYDPDAFTTVEEIVAYYETQQPSNIYGPGVIAEPLADMLFFAPLSDPNTSGNYPWTDPTAPWYLIPEYQFSLAPPGFETNNIGMCNDPTYHEILGATPYAEWHKADAHRVTRYTDGAFGCNLSYTYEYYADHPTNHKFIVSGYYSRIYGQTFNGKWQSYNATTYTNSLYAFGFPVSRAFVTSQSLNIAGQRTPIIQHGQWSNLDQTTDYGFMPGWVDMQGLCFHGEFTQWNQVKGDESAGYDALSMVNLKTTIGYGLDPFNAADMRGSEATIAAVQAFKLLTETAIVDAGGSLYDPMVVLDSRHLDQQSEFWGHTAVDIRDDDGTIASTPMYNLKLYLIPMITNWQTSKETMYSEEVDAE